MAMLEELADDAPGRGAAVPRLRGLGGARAIDDIEDAAFHLLDVLDRLGLRPWCDIVGLSLGGWMAAELAVRWPERVRRMVLVNAVGLYVRGRAHHRDLRPAAVDELAAELFADPESSRWPS